MPPILRVALPVPLHALYDYLAPEGDVPPVGSRVLVPFGRRALVGLVAAVVRVPDVEPSRLKTVSEVLDHAPVFTPELWQTLGWAARYYQHPLGDVLSTALPATLRSPRPLPESGEAGWRLTAAGRKARTDPERRAAPRMDALLDALAAGPLASRHLRPFASPLRTARERGWVEAVRVAGTQPPPMHVPGHPLNAAQQAATTAVIGSLGHYAAFLLEGVTGSGKTEVYLEIVRACLAGGLQSLVLIPEIALTPQLLRRFEQGLGVPVTALHSGLGEVERAGAWLAAGRGEAGVVLGTRSAVLAPLTRPGVLIVDEEHDPSYKQQDGWRYHARDLALVRARALGVPVVLGSATPSLESLANVEAGRYRRLPLPERAGGAQPPRLTVLDLRRQRTREGLSPAALAAIARCVERDEQALVFRNRRGFAPVLLCGDCGWRAMCEACERAFTLHRHAARLRCHHCAGEQPLPRACPACASLALVPVGEGTERLDEYLRQRFPDVPVVRVDRDTTRGRRTREALLQQLPGAGARILVGTQMLAKGHDFPHLTLVVVVGVDEGLHSVDFRASERLGQLLVQVAGRAGRAEKPGEVLLQTHLPDDRHLATLLAGGYPALASTLLAERREANLPPFSALALLRAEAADPERLQAFLVAAAAEAGALAVHGPMAAPMPRRAGLWRGQLLAEAATRGRLQALLPAWLAAVRTLPDGRKLRWSIDVDPVDLY